jgi:hypothetical protein
MARNWDYLIKQAEKDLAKNKALIESSPRGIPSGNNSSYKRGKSPGSTVIKNKGTKVK